MTIYTSIIGGLGNQMFQYATGRALALRHHTELRLDVSGYANYRLHQGYELERVFGCNAARAAAAELHALLGWQFGPLARRILARPAFAALRSPQMVIEPQFNYWPEIANVPDNCYLAGYWQSEKYFKEYEADIRAEFTFRPSLDAPNAALADEVRSANAVSLHVRRGDYAGNSKTHAVHGLCTLDYYRAAIAQIARRIESPRFFVFSDDIRWAEENLRMEFPAQFIGNNQGAQSYVDMQLMSLCQHHIIANSSFSWWGAWLNPSPHKIVIAPQQWFAVERKIEDLIPLGWIRL